MLQMLNPPIFLPCSIQDQHKKHRHSSHTHKHTQTDTDEQQTDYTHPLPDYDTSWFNLTSASTDWTAHEVVCVSKRLRVNQYKWLVELLAPLASINLCDLWASYMHTHIHDCVFCQHRSLINAYVPLLSYIKLIYGSHKWITHKKRYQ